MAPTKETMKGLAYNGVGKIVIEERPVPTIKKPADAVVKMVYSTICGSALHILKGDVPSVAPGRVLGHEGVGIVTATRSNVSRFAPGDADGACVLGNAMDGTKAQYVRRAGRARGAAHSAALHPERRGRRRPGRGAAGRGAAHGRAAHGDAVMEVVGVPRSFALCQELVAAGGVIANVGVHGEKVDLHLERLWSRNIAITTRLVDTVTTPMLLKLFVAGQLPAEKLITHTFPFPDIVAAYDAFRAARKTKALKVIVDFEQDVPGAAGTRDAKL